MRLIIAAIFSLASSTTFASTTFDVEEVRLQLVSSFAGQGEIRNVTERKSVGSCEKLVTFFGSIGGSVQRFDFQLQKENGDNQQNMVACVESNHEGQSSWEYYPSSVIAD